LAVRCVLRRDVPSPASPFSNAVRPLRAELQVHRVPHCVPANAGRCIPRGSRLQDRVRWAWVRRFRLLEPRVPEVDPVVRREGLASAMFRAA
jgi:hypothetical protein